MLKSTYERLDAIPEGQREFYSLQNGKYVLQLDDEHPVIVNNKELQREKTTAQGQITRLTNEKTALEATQLPAGHVAVPSADAQQLTAYQSHGKPDEFKAAKEERDTLKTKAGEMERSQLLRDVLDAQGWKATPEQMKTITGADQIEIKEIEEDGQKVKRAFVSVEKDGKTESVAAREKYVDWLGILEQEGQQGTPYIPQTKGATPTKASNPVAARQQAREEARKANPNPLMPKTASATT